MERDILLRVRRVHKAVRESGIEQRFQVAAPVSDMEYEHVLTFHPVDH